jgi:hypothetical protein
MVNKKCNNSIKTKKNLKMFHVKHLKAELPEESVLNPKDSYIGSNRKEQHHHNPEGGRMFLI